eukprot:TRINITY_DN13275_c0_g1_i1.p1 TRINITY_DN13275_c0_g1~~TRINITY_DN13275_c0_g1_i1.p1  ORF type:complete len:538 (-),score=170.07 TRINITY_DN13275_c0_g1_i1:45-1658(-)
MLLEALHKRTPEEHPDHGEIGRAMELVEQIAHSVDESYSKQEKSSRFTLLVNEFCGSHNLIVAHRKLLKEGELMLAGGKVELQVLLCNDIIIIFPTNKPRSSTCIDNAIYAWPLSLVWVDKGAVEGNGFAIIGPGQSYSVEFAEAYLAIDWHKELTSAINKHLSHTQQETENCEDLGAPRYEKDFIRFPVEIEGTAAQEQVNLKGRFVNGMMNGEGDFKFFLHRFSGMFKDGVRHGPGEFVCMNKDRFKGTMVDGAPDGKGAMNFYNGGTYIGMWKNGLPNGDGVFKSPTGFRYDGKWESGVPHGTGALEMPGGSKYEGEFHCGVMQGNGKLTFASGVYIGAFAGGYFDGVGMVSYADGEKYEGTWKAGKRDGKGILTSKNLNYDGEWKEGLMHGKGTLNLKSGSQSRYVGELKYGLFHGKGTYSNGEDRRRGSPIKEIQGHWTSGKMDGNCKLFYHCDPPLVLKGAFKDGSLHGSVTYQLGGEKMSATYVDGLREHKKGAHRCARGATETDIESQMMALSVRSFGSPLDIVDFAFL